MSSLQNARYSFEFTIPRELIDHSHDCGHNGCMKISKSALKAKMLEYFRRVEETGEPLVSAPTTTAPY